MGRLPRAIRHFFRDTKRNLRNGVLSLLTPPLVACLGALSPRRAAKIARAAAAFAARFKLQPFRISCQNLAVAFPEQSPAWRQQTAQTSLANSIRTGFDVLRFLKHPENATANILPLPQELLDDAHDKPLIVCLPHLGNWEAFGQTASLFETTCSAVAEPLANKHLDNLLTRARQLNGLHIIPRDGAARKLLAALHQKHTVGLLVDQNLSPHEGGVFASFFGLPATTILLPALLARKLHVKIVVSAAILTPDDHVQILCQNLPRSPEDYPSELELTQDILHAFEQLIRQYPEQYTWTYRRWRYLPQNTPQPLADAFPPYADRKPYDAPQPLLDRLTQDLASHGHH